jgi:hypothetical protein
LGRILQRRGHALGLITRDLPNFLAEDFLTEPAVRLAQ